MGLVSEINSDVALSTKAKVVGGICFSKAMFWDSKYHVRRTRVFFFLFFYCGVFFFFFFFVAWRGVAWRFSLLFPGLARLGWFKTSHGWFLFRNRGFGFKRGLEYFAEGMYYF